MKKFFLTLLMLFIFAYSSVFANGLEQIRKILSGTSRSYDDLPTLPTSDNTHDQMGNITVNTGHVFSPIMKGTTKDQKFSFIVFKLIDINDKNKEHLEFLTWETTGSAESGFGKCLVNSSSFQNPIALLAKVGITNSKSGNSDFNSVLATISQLISGSTISIMVEKSAHYDVQLIPPPILINAADDVNIVPVTTSTLGSLYTSYKIESIASPANSLVDSSSASFGLRSVALSTQVMPKSSHAFSGAQSATLPQKTIEDTSQVYNDNTHDVEYVTYDYKLASESSSSSSSTK